MIHELQEALLCSVHEALVELFIIHDGTLIFRYTYFYRYVADKEIFDLTKISNI